MKIRTSDDKFANYFALPSFGDSRGSEPINTKPNLHQFKGDFRFHQASAVEFQSGRLKLHVTDRLRMAISGLAGYIEYTQDAWMKAKKAFDSDISYDPTVWVTFLLLVHRGDHYRYTNRASLELAQHTTLFTSFNSAANSIPLVVDFIKHDSLLGSLKTIDESFVAVANHILRYLQPSPRPLKDEIRKEVRPNY
jgi:hypothetical protein